MLHDVIQGSEPDWRNGSFLFIANEKRPWAHYVPRRWLISRLPAHLTPLQPTQWQLPLASIVISITENGILSCDMMLLCFLLPKQGLNHSWSPNCWWCFFIVVGLKQRITLCQKKRNFYFGRWPKMCLWQMFQQKVFASCSLMYHHTRHSMTTTITNK